MSNSQPEPEPKPQATCKSAVAPAPADSWFQFGPILILLWRWSCRNPGAISALATICGALVLFAPILQMGFLPDLELSSVLGTITLVALITPVVIFIFALIILLPALLGRFFIIKIHDPSNPERGKFIFIRMAVITALWLIITAVDVIIAKWTDWRATIALCITTLVIVALPAIKNKTFGNIYVHTYRCAVLFLVMSLSFFLASHAVNLDLAFEWSQTGIAQPEEWLPTILDILWVLAVGWSNVWLTQTAKITARMLFAFGSATILGFFAVSNVLGYLHVMPLKYLNVVGVENVTITVSRKASEAMQAACREAYIFGIPEIAPWNCSKIPEASPQETVSYKNVTILSRLGNQYYLRICQYRRFYDDCAGNQMEIVIDKKDVYGWSKSPHIYDSTLSGIPAPSPY